VSHVKGIERPRVHRQWCMRLSHGKIVTGGELGIGN
jgi:hypothetical protein